MSEFERYFNVALRFLSYRPRSEKEVREYLKIKDQKSKIKNKQHKINELEIASIIDTVIQKLKDQNFLNDSEFASWWIRQRTEIKPKGLFIIKMELRQKGIPEEIIEEKLRNTEIKISGKERLQNIVERKMRQYKGLSRRQLYQKLSAFLQRRGFDFETIKGVIDEVIKKRV